MSQNNPPIPPTIPSGGAYIQTIGMVRDMKVYPMVESDLKHITWLNSSATALFSVGTIILIAAIGLLLDIYIEGSNLTTLAVEVLRVLVGFGLGIVLILYVFGVLVWKARGSELRRILSESREATQ